MANSRFMLPAAVLIAAIAWTPASATSFGTIVVLGDSLSDTGNVFDATGGLPLPPYAPGRISNGPVWVEQLAANLGLSSIMHSGAGGTNYAFAGALTGVDGSLSPFPGIVPSLTTQLTTYLGDTGGTADSDALYVIWGGGNNIRSDSGNAASDIAGIVSDLAALGATNFIVPNLPNIGATPESMDGLAPACLLPDGSPNPAVDCPALMGELTMSHNDALASALDALAVADPSLNILLFDVFSIFNALIADPGMFGFTNATDRCWDGNSFGAGTQCDNPDEYVFWDGIHPTAAGHALLGDMVFAQVVPIPAAVWLFGSALLGLVGMRKRVA